MLRKTDQRRAVDCPGLIASMRPQRNAAENKREFLDRNNALLASMRPQRNAAENLGACVQEQRAYPGFNEAAA